MRDYETLAAEFRKSLKSRTIREAKLEIGAFSGMFAHGVLLEHGYLAHSERLILLMVAIERALQILGADVSRLKTGVIMNTGPVEVALFTLRIGGELAQIDERDAAIEDFLNEAFGYLKAAWLEMERVVEEDVTRVVRYDGV